MLKNDLSGIRHHQAEKCCDVDFDYMCLHRHIFLRVNGCFSVNGSGGLCSTFQNYRKGSNICV